ncbi:Ig family protein [Dickeya chrysanthemi Ech1591]|uniref:Ig family protein n=1 Tax=Dickeya chrysanthemi (strain Ech1591) TaxID=561229 RepID=C6CI36_DICC1|nr:Ig family protein [Dickeya chrysanthemi Ech1591]
MLWRHLFGNRYLFSNKRSNPARSVELTADMPLGYALEARMLFDGAIAATVDQTNPAQNTTTATTDMAVHADDSHAQNSTGQTDSSSRDSGTKDTATKDTSTDGEKVAVAGEAVQTHKEVVFIDTSVADYQTLVNQVPAGTDVVLLDSSKDGLTQMAAWAQTHSGYDAIHIISHGSEGQVSLGTLTLNTTTAASRSADLATLGSALTNDGDLLLYGCDVASNTGAEFLTKVADLTGADVAASTDATGASTLGGDWTLEAVNKDGIIDSHGLLFSHYSYLLDTLTFGDTGHENEFSYGSSTFTRVVNSATITFTSVDAFGNATYSGRDYLYNSDSPNNQTEVTLSVTGYTFDINSFKYYAESQSSSEVAPTVTIIVTYANNSTATASFLATQDSEQIVSNFSFNNGQTTINDVISVTIKASNGSSIPSFGMQDLVINDVRAITSQDSTSTLTAGAASEATTFSTTATSVGSATSLMDFTITDTGASDGVATTVSALYANVSGSATSSELSQMTFLLSGPDATNVVGTYNSGTGRVTFSGLNVSIADGGSETYTIKAYYNDNISSSDITDHHTVVLSINASNVTTGSGSSTFAGSQANVTSGSGASIDVAATQLVYNQPPSTSVVSGINFTTQPVVYAVDARGNIDTDFNSSVTLSENGSGSLTGTTQVTASNGIATFSGVKYTSASDADANFVLTAASGSLVSATSASINPDVVATRLVFSTQPVPTTIQNGQSTNFTTVPVVQAVDANGIVDQDYTTNIVLSVTDPNDSVVDGTINSLTVTSGDNDGSATTVTLTPSGGIATYTGLIIQYTNSGSANTLALRATSGGLTAINSSSITSTTNAAPVFSNLNGGATYTENGSAVVMDNNVTVADTELDALNSGQGNYNGASITIARNGGASSNDTFGNSGLLGALTQGQNFTYNGTTVGSVTTNSGGTLTLTFNSNATSAMVDAVLQSLTYANSSDDPPASVTLNWTFNDGSLNSSGSNQAVLSITPVNDAPVISNTSVSKTFNEDSAQTFSASDFGFSDVDSGDTLQSITIVTAPTAGELFIDANSDGVRGVGDTLLGDGAVVSAANIGKLTFRPAANANGAGYATFNWTVSDGTASSANMGTMTLNVTAVNDAPVISNTSVSKTFNEDSAQTFSAADFGFSDVDSGNTLQSITIVTGPSVGELFIDANSDGVRGGGDTLLGNGAVVSAADIGKLTFRPTANANGAGYAAFTWKVSDGTALSGNTGTMTLNVTPVNDAPTLSNGVTVTLTSTTEDVTSSATTVSSLLSNAGYGDVDSGASSGIAITTTAGNGGWQYSTDSGANWFSIGTVSGSSALLLSSTAQVRYVPDSANGETATLGFRAWDQTSGTATAGASKGLADTSTTGGSSAFSTNNAQASLVVTSVNDAPTVGSPVSLQSATKDTAFSFTVPGGTFVDVDSGDTLTLSATQSDGSPLPTWLSFNPSTRTFSGTPGSNDVGNLTIRVTATDGSNASVSTTFGLTVNNSNLPPVVSVPVADQAIAQNGGFSFTVPAGTFTDPDTGDTLTLSATQSDGSPLPTWLSFNPSTRTFSGTPGSNDVGNLTIRVTATDGSNASVSTTFGLTVNNSNLPPVVSVPVADQAIAQNGGFSFTVPAGTFTDPDTGDTLTLSATQSDGSALPGWLSFNPSTRTFSGTPGNGDVGNLTIRVTATDGSNASVSTTFGLNVTNVNDAPVVSGSLAAQTVAQNGGFSFTVPAGTFTDPDSGDTLTLSATQADGSALPGWLSFNPATRTFSGTPGNGDVGNLTIRVTATDGSNASVSTTFGLVVTGSTVDNGDPEFRINGGTSVPPTATPVPVVTVAPAAPVTLGALFSSTSLGALNTGATADNATAASTIFQAAQRAPQVNNGAPVSQIAGAFVQGVVSGSASLFDSSLGSFPSFNTGGALGGSSSLAGLFSGISLPSLSPMAVFSGGSWRDINTNGANSSRLTTGLGAMQFAPDLEQQLQHLGDDTQQRLAAMEQALNDIGQITRARQQG